MQGVEGAKATDREYTAIEYLRQTHGLKYDEVVTLLDPTGQTARARYREASRFPRLYARGSPDSSLRAGQVNFPALSCSAYSCP